MSAQVRSAATGQNAGGSAFTVTPPVGIMSGDLWIIEALTGTALGTPSDDVAKGWWRLGTVAANTRAYTLLARIYNPLDPVGDYTLTQGASAFTKWLGLAVQDHAVTTQSDIVLGSIWRRQDNGGSSGVIVAPSLTTIEVDSLLIAFTGEASNALGGYAATTLNGFTKAAELTEGPTAATDIEWISAWSKLQPTVGATGLFQITYTPTALNGVGQQIAVPSATDPTPPASGCIGSRVPTSVLHDSITVGVDRINGTVIEIAAKLGATEVARQTVAIDATSGWGSTTFTGLEPDSSYGFDFYVDDVLQTDTQALILTHPAPGTPTSFKFVTGSCQFTGSNHPIWDRIREENARQLGHMGDLHYGDATTLEAWRAAVESSLTAPRFRAMLGLLPVTWTWDNHDRIITNPAGAGTGLNLGETDPATNTEWRKLAGTAGWASADTAGRSWVIGRVRFIQTDQWTVRDDGDGDPAPRTFLGVAQKQWFKDTLDAATEEVIVWLCQWTGQNHANGRWNSFPEETAELEAFINARPAVKARMVMIGGDSHSLQVTDGARTLADGQRFAGIPNYNISGFNRTSDAGQGGAGWLDDRPLRATGQPEADWGGYSRLTFTDDGEAVTLLWEGVRVDPTGATDVMNAQTLVFAGSPPQPFDAVYVGDVAVSALYVGSTQIWP